MIPWIEYRLSLGFLEVEKFIESHDFSEFLKNQFKLFEDDPSSLSTEDLKKIVTELKSKIYIPNDIFKEINILINLEKEPIEPYLSFSNPDFVIYKKQDEWELYHIESRTLVSKVNTRGTGKCQDSIKLAYITEPFFQGQGLTTELVKMFIQSLKGLIEINAVNEASKRIALKLEFKFNPETRTYLYDS